MVWVSTTCMLHTLKLTLINASLTFKCRVWNFLNHNLSIYILYRMVNQSSTINPFSVQVSIALIAIQMACFCSLSARLLLISHNFLFASVAFIFFFSYPLPAVTRERVNYSVTNSQSSAKTSLADGIHESA